MWGYLMKWYHANYNGHKYITTDQGIADLWTPNKIVAWKYVTDNPAALKGVGIDAFKQMALPIKAASCGICVHIITKL